MIVKGKILTIKLGVGDITLIYEGENVSIMSTDEQESSEITADELAEIANAMLDLVSSNED